MSRCISASGVATPFLSVSSKVKPMPSTMLPWKLFPAFAVSRTGSRWPPRWKRNAVIVSAASPSRRFAFAAREASFGDVQHAHHHRREAGAT